MRSFYLSLVDLEQVEFDTVFSRFESSAQPHHKLKKQKQGNKVSGAIGSIQKGWGWFVGVALTLDSEGVEVSGSLSLSISYS